MKNLEMLQSKQREIHAKMATASVEELAELQREFDSYTREIDMELHEREAAKTAPKADNGIVKQIREAFGSNNKTFTINAGIEKREGEIIKNAHTTETDVQGILEPLYANSLLTKLGCRWYTGLPMGDIQIPVMGKGTVGWKGEVAAADKTAETFTHKTLQPKRLTAYVDISKAFLLADTVGAESAIRRDLVKAVNDKLEATVFGHAAASNSPKGMFWNADATPAAVRTLEDANSFAKVCGIEAGLEEANVYDLKYVLSPKAKADLRAMAKSSKNTQLVLEGGAVDGVPAFTSSNVVDSDNTTKGAYIVGDFSNLAIGSWGDVQVTVDEFSQAINGCVRLVVSFYVDAVVLREGAFKYGDTRHA